MIPNGSRHVPCARLMASRKSAADSSSQCTESLVGAGDCATTTAADKRFKATRIDLDTRPPKEDVERKPQIEYVERKASIRRRPENANGVPSRDRRSCIAPTIVALDANHGRRALDAPAVTVTAAVPLTLAGRDDRRGARRDRLDKARACNRRLRRVTQGPRNRPPHDHSTSRVGQR